ncbi:hypothetical protein F0Q45_02970 [Mycobacterium simiae]|uniref:UsfY protein n=1 Tax=Mycobacterium simiae TaxID=1784 RepID=A0A5B1BWH2_MYCSI|nr:hypothetical protein [Mycobacterium simiae]KAA1251733.1 hypothetical protein F0Q45_02970 [Mycobacterium simiae]
MKDPESDPVDHERTFRQHAGESLNKGANAPGMAGVAVAVVALVIGLFALATDQTTAGWIAVIVAVAAGTAGLAWLNHTHRRVRDAELEWHSEHSGKPAPPPSS